MASSVTKLNLRDLPKAYQDLGKRLMPAAMRGALRGALRAVSTMQRATTEEGVVNTGFYRMAWKSEALPDGARVYNAAKYAGVIEYGRRPGSFPPVSVIEHWAQRRLGLSKKEARAAAFPIARAIARRGIPGKRVLTGRRPQLDQDFLEEVRKELDLELQKGLP